MNARKLQPEDYEGYAQELSVLEDRPQPPKIPPLSSWTALPRHSGKIVGAALLFSLLVHLISGGYLANYQGNGSNMQPFATKPEKVKIRIVDAEMMQQKPKDKDVQDFKKMLEMPQAKTLPPENARYSGQEDHRTEKETKLADTVKREKAANAGVKGAPTATAKERKPEVTEQKAQPPPQTAQKAMVPKTSMGSVSFEAQQRKPRNAYEGMLPSKMQDLAGQIDAGYQDYIDDKIDEGDRIDINTSEYRYIGYFTNMRKEIERVWIYPEDAIRRGLQGETILEFAIDKRGYTSRIRVLKSSGYEILDRSMVETIKTASPFAPLPEGFHKERIIVVGAFRYILTAFGTH